MPSPRARRSPAPLAVLALLAALALTCTARASPRACPGGQRPTPTGCASTTPSLRTVAAPPAAATQRPSPDHPFAPEVQLRPEPSRLEKADRRLLVEEIARLERLVGATPPRSADRAGLLLRLADSYAELTALADRDHTLREIEADDARRKLERAEKETAKQVDGSHPAPAKPASGPPRRPIRM